DYFSVRILMPDFDHFTGGDDFRAEAFRLRHGASGEVGSAHPSRKSKVVFDARARPGLSTRSVSFDDNRAQALRSAVDGACQAGGTAAYDDQVVERRPGTRLQPDLLGQLVQRGLVQGRTVGEEIGRASCREREEVAVDDGGGARARG